MMTFVNGICMKLYVQACALANKALQSGEHGLEVLMRLTETVKYVQLSLTSRKEVKHVHLILSSGKQV
jgi:hypothetical protein